MPQLNYPIQTMCIDLIDASRQLPAACHFGSNYTYSYMTNTTSGSDSYPYLVAFGNNYSFGSP